MKPFNYLSALLIVTITFFFLISFSIKAFNEGELQTKIEQCATFIDLSGGKPVFFGKEQTKPTRKFITALENLCVVQNRKISTQNQLENFLKSCHKMGGSGKKDFFGATSKSLGINLYCGKITIEKDFDFDFESFKERTNEKHSFLKSRGLINLNKKILENLPSKFKKNDEYYLWFSVYKGEIETIFGKVKTSFISSLGNTFGGNWLIGLPTNVLISKYDNEIEGFAHILLLKKIGEEKIKEKDFEENEPLNDIFFIIPKEIIDFT